MKKNLLLIILLCSPMLLWGNIYFKNLGKTEGLPQLSTVSICQDELGRMWFGTLEGLGCYDGTTMKTFKPSQTGAEHILGNEIGNVVTDKQGNLFFMSDRLLIRYDLHKESFSRLPLKVTCLHEQKHEIWTATKDSVFKWNNEIKQFTFLFKYKPCYISDSYKCMLQI